MSHWRQRKCNTWKSRTSQGYTGHQRWCWWMRSPVWGSNVYYLKWCLWSVAGFQKQATRPYVRVLLNMRTSLAQCKTILAWSEISGANVSFFTFTSTFANTLNNHIHSINLINYAALHTCYSVTSAVTVSCQDYTCRHPTNLKYSGVPAIACGARYVCRRNCTKSRILTTVRTDFVFAETADMLTYFLDESNCGW